MFSDPTAKLLAQALTYFEQGQLRLAESLYQQVLKHQPNQTDALQCLGMIAAQQGQTAIAIGYFRQAVQAQPEIAGHHYNLGYALQTDGDVMGAIAAYQQALNLESNHLAACYNLASLHLGIGNPVAAIQHFQIVLQLQPDLVAAHTGLGSAYLDLGLLDLSTTCYQKALALDPNQPNALYNLGLISQVSGNLSEAVSSYNRLLAIQPNDSDVCIKLGSSYLSLGEVNSAIAAYQRAVNLAPESSEAHSGLATSLLQQPDLERSIYHYDQACQRAPKDPEAHFNRAIALLLSGDLAQGFAEYEWRNQRIDASMSVWEFDHPYWQGEDLRGRTLLLHPEQGFGDLIQFIRYLPVMTGGQVIVECYSPLRRLFSNIAGIDQLYTDGDPVPTIDFQAPLMSLPKLFGTTLSTIPAQIPYLTPPPEISIPGLNNVETTQKRVGIVWDSSSHSDTAQKRSCPLEMFLFLAAQPELRLYSLQVRQTVNPQRLEAYKVDAQLLQVHNIADLSPHLKDFADTAVAIAALDLVITIDTAVAHLAGALGKPVWVLLPYIPDWRWLLNRSDSPWYPTMRLFRQPQPGDWAGAWKQVESALEDFCQSR